MSTNARLAGTYRIYMQINMKFIKIIFSFIATAAVALGCSGTVDDSTLPVLAASAAEVDLAVGGSVEFTVTYGGDDVTAEAVVFMGGSTVPDVFIPAETGSYEFYAEYDGKQSNAVTVDVINTAQRVESKYEKHVLIIEFTGAWCTFCPAGYDRMMMTLQGPSMSRHKDRIHISAFHSNSTGSDAMAIPATEDVFDLFRKDGIEFPSFVCDLRYAGNLNQEGISYFKESLTAALNDDSVHCGVAVSSSVNEAGTGAAVTVKVVSEQTSDYRVVLLVVEDKVKCPETPQKSPTYPNGNPNHVHGHVVRQVATSYKGTFTGETITETGRIKAGEEASKTWNVEIDSKWKIEDTYIYALVIDKDGYVNNMNVCHIENGNSDYNLKK